MVVVVVVVAEAGVAVPAWWCPAPSSLEGSGVEGRLFAELKFGRSRDVSDGLGGRGVGGRL